jgi:ribosomal protein L31
MIGGNESTLMETCFQCHCFYHGSHVARDGVELGSPR